MTACRRILAAACLVLLLFWLCAAPRPAASQEAAGERCTALIMEHLLMRPFPQGLPPGLPPGFALLLADEVPVYGDPRDPDRGREPLRHLGSGFVTVSLEQDAPITVDGETWYLINPGEYVEGKYLKILRPSGFQGVLLPHFWDRPFAWILFDTQVSASPGTPPDAGGLVLPGRSLVFVEEMREVGGRLWCAIGCGWWIPYNRVGLVRKRPRPEAIPPGARWIEVNLHEQTLCAYEDDRMVFSTLVSSGADRFPSVEGVFRVWLKFRKKKMSGPGYFLEDVPWQMFFYQGYALHSSYWHDYFGLPASHGCINLSLKDAKWLFDWSSPKVPKGMNWVESTPDNPGTWVWVHQGLER